MQPATPPSGPAIIVAAGSSTRMGFDKLSAPLGNSNVLAHSVRQILAASSISSVIIVGPPALASLLDPANTPKPLLLTPGGTDRQASVAAGLAALDKETGIVAIHDGARPLVRPQDVDRVMAKAALCGAASLARKATETLIRANPDGTCPEPVDRTNLWIMETPQAFDINMIKTSLAKTRAAGLVFTDEVSAAQFAGHVVALVESSHPNPKITVPADLALAEALLSTRP